MASFYILLWVVCSYRKALKVFRCYFVWVGIAQAKKNLGTCSGIVLARDLRFCPFSLWHRGHLSKLEEIMCCRAFCPRYKRTMQRPNVALRTNAIDHRERCCKRRVVYIRTSRSWRSVPLGSQKDQPDEMAMLCFTLCNKSASCPYRSPLGETGLDHSTKPQGFQISSSFHPDFSSLL